MIKQTPFTFYEVEDHIIVQEMGKPLESVYAYVVKKLREHTPGEDNWYGIIEEYFDIADRYAHPRRCWPTNCNWISVFAVTGGSEGHYIHVEAITDDKRELLFLGKTFQGLDHALECVKVLSHRLEV